MERKKITNYKLWGLMILVCISLNYCKTKEKSIEFSSIQNRYFKFVGRDTVRNMLFNNIIRIISKNNTDYYFTNFFAKGIFKTNQKFSSGKRIGKKGQGPGEYHMPFYIDLIGSRIFYSDITTPLIKTINVDDDNISHIDYLAKMGGSKFVINNGFLFSLWSGNPAISIFNYRDGNVISNILNIDKSFDLFRRKVVGGAILTDSTGRVFVLPVQPYKMYVLNQINGIYKVENIYNLNKKIAINSWSKSLNEKYNRSNDDEKDKIINNINYVINAEIIGHDKSYILVQLNDQKGFFYHLIDTNGNIIERFYSHKLKLIGKDKDHLFFLKELDGQDCEPCVIIEKYSLELK